VQDGSIVDATTIKVHDARREECPGAGDDAARKGPKVLSVGCGAPGRYPVSPARDHDRPHRRRDESWRGYGRLADLADASRARLRACATSAVRCGLRRQDPGQPKGDDSARGQVARELCPGTDREALLDDDTLVLDGRALDAEVHVGGATHPRHLRRVGVQSPNGSGFARTTLPPRLGPRQVADLYRVGWEVARRITLDQSVHRLDQLDAERPCAVKALLQASRLASTIAAGRAHTHHRNTRPHEAGAPRTAAPLHPRLLAWPRAVSCPFIAQALALQGTAARRRWDKSAERLTQAGADPNWRRRPSVLDQVRGWKRQSVARAQHRNHRLQMAA
jgi:hypothetical protein